MAFTVAELDSITNGVLEYYIKKQPYLQSIQDKPLLAALEGKRKTFPGGKELIRLPVKGDYTLTAQGYTHDDAVNYGTPANIKRIEYRWKEVHLGLTLTHTELKIDGISVVDSAMSRSTSKHSNREMTAIVNLLEDKMEDMSESSARALNNFFWSDGTAVPNAMQGVQAFITNTPAVGLTGGLDRALNPWWQNRYVGGIAAGTSLVRTIHTEMRQLRRYGGRPTIALAGSSFLDRLVQELHTQGEYTNSGWKSRSNTNIAFADVAYNDLVFRYDPSLDDLGLDRECFLIDPRHLYIYAMQSEWGKRHAPARPHDQYVMYRAITWTGELCADQLNCHGRLEIA